MPKKKGKSRANKAQKPVADVDRVPPLNEEVKEDTPTSSNSLNKSSGPVVEYVNYADETQMSSIMALIGKDLSEPYSIFTYRYFICNWPELCLLANVDGQLVGAIVCKADKHRTQLRGYIAMLAVDKDYRKLGIGSTLAQKAIDKMIEMNCTEVVLETEVTNSGALCLYENLGFARDSRLCKYYLNGVDAFRLKLWLSP